MRSAHTFLLKNLLTVTTIKFEKVNNTTSEAKKLRMWHGLHWLRIVAHCKFQHLV